MLGVSHPSLSLPSRRWSNLRHMWLSQALRGNWGFVQSCGSRQELCCHVREDGQGDSKGTSEQRAGDEGRKFKGKSHYFRSLKHPVPPQQLQEMVWTAGLAVALQGQWKTERQGSLEHFLGLSFNALHCTHVLQDSCFELILYGLLSGMVSSLCIKLLTHMFALYIHWIRGMGWLQVNGFSSWSVCQ